MNDTLFFLNPRSLTTSFVLTTLRQNILLSYLIDTTIVLSLSFDIRLRHQILEETTHRCALFRNHTETSCFDCVLLITTTPYQESSPKPYVWLRNQSAYCAPSRFTKILMDNWPFQHCAQSTHWILTLLGLGL